MWGSERRARPQDLRSTMCMQMAFYCLATGIMPLDSKVGSAIPTNKFFRFAMTETIMYPLTPKIRFLCLSALVRGIRLEVLNGNLQSAPPAMSASGTTTPPLHWTYQAASGLQAREP